MNADTNIKFEELKTVAKLDVPAGKRLCRIINKGKDSISVGAHVPMLTNEDIIKLFADSTVNEFLVNSLYGVQDKIVRGSLKDNMLDTATLSPEMIIAFLAEEKEESTRLSKVKIEQWFDADMAPVLSATLKTKGLQDKQIAETVAVFRNSFTVLAQREPSMKDNVKNQLNKALSLLPDDYDNVVAEKIASKLLEVTEATVELNAL